MWLTWSCGARLRVCCERDRYYSFMGYLYCIISSIRTLGSVWVGQLSVSVNWTFALVSRLWVMIVWLGRLVIQ